MFDKYVAKMMRSKEGRDVLRHKHGFAGTDSNGTPIFKKRSKKRK